MKQKAFNAMLREFALEKHNYELSEYEVSFCFRHFNKTVEDIKSGKDASELVEMVDYDDKKVILLRNIMAANLKIEFTPRQTKLYLIALDIALITENIYTKDE